MTLRGGGALGAAGSYFFGGNPAAAPTGGGGGPRGYARGGVNENPAFDPHFAIEVNAPSGPLSALPGRRE